MTKSIEEKTIRGHVYSGSFIPASEACVIAYKLAKIINGNSEDVMKLIASEGLENKQNHLMLSILSYTLRDNAAINKATFDSIYTGNLGELLEALQFAIEVNFGDFLPGEGFGLLKEKPHKEEKTTDH